MLASPVKIFDSTNAADGQWTKISNMSAFSVHVLNLEGNVWIEVSNDPNAPINGTNAVNAPTAPTLSQFQYGALASQGTADIKISYVTPNGESLPSAHSTLALTDGYQLVVKSPAPDAAGIAKGYNVYAKNAAGVWVLQNTPNTSNQYDDQKYNGTIALGIDYIAYNGIIGTGVPAPSSSTAGSPAVGVNITGNLAATTYVAPTPEFGETQIVTAATQSPLAAPTQAMVNPSCLVWAFLRVRKDSTAQTKETVAWLLGQNG